MINPTIAHNQITAKLGQGGVGEVCRATDTQRERDVAIKVLPKSFADDSVCLTRLERKGKMLVALDLRA